MAHRKSPTKKKWRHDNEKSPVYKHPAAYAREHDELAAYRASNQANEACKEAIEAAIRDHYRITGWIQRRSISGAAVWL